MVDQPVWLWLKKSLHLPVTMESPYTACTTSISASTSSSLTMRERCFFSFLFWQREKNKDAFSSFYSNVVF